MKPQHLQNLQKNDIFNIKIIDIIIENNRK